MAVIGKPLTLHKKHAFIVEIDGVKRASFAKCSELSFEIAKIQYFEGGALIANKSPGRVTFSDLTLERGATDDHDLYDWATEVIHAAAGIGFIDDVPKRDFDIVQQARDKSTVRRWSVFQNWPVKFVAGEWDNDADEVVIEQLTTTYDYFVLEK